MSAQLTVDEKKVLDMTVELVNAYAALPKEHPSDLVEFCYSIHQIQNSIMSRLGD